jgi:hypothetical protein
VSAIIEVHGYRVGNKIEALLDLISDTEVREAVESGASINALDVIEMTEELEGLRETLAWAYSRLGQLVTLVVDAADAREAAERIAIEPLREWEADLDKIHLRLGEWL